MALLEGQEGLGGPAIGPGGVRRLYRSLRGPPGGLRCPTGG